MKVVRQAEKLVTALVFVNETVDKKKRQLEKFNDKSEDGIAA